MTSTAIQDGRRGVRVGAYALALAFALLGPRVAAGEDGIAPIYHKDKSFRIPFDLGGKDMSRIKELQLWSSEDSGFHWNPTSQATPDQQQFMFRSRHDGEYWFAVRMMSSSGQISPPIDEPVKPALKVIVDTRPPTLVLESEGRQGSRARVRWEARDENLDLKKLAVEYQIAGARDWKRAPIRAAVAVGRADWDANTVESIRVRGTVADLAGNVVETEVELPEGASSPPDMASLDPDANAAPAVEPFRRGRSPIVADPSFTPVQEDAGTAPVRSASSGWNGSGGNRPVARQARAGTDSLMSSAPPTPNWESAANATPAAQAFSSSTTSTRPPGFPDPFPNQDVPPSGATGAGAAASREPAQAGEGEGSTMVVGGPRFRLKYDVQDPGPDGRAAIVELWMTRDGGRTWLRRGEDPDRTSPIDVDLGGEGTFGLSLVARSSSGLGDQPPAAGDLPQTWVEVDSSPPSVHLYRPTIGTGVHSGKIALAWRAEDLHLGAKPVSLSWRPDQPGAAWVPIADAGPQDAVGQFVWTVPPNFPPKFHVRVEAFDGAGNRGVAETPEGDPVIVDRSRPKSRIIGLDANERAGAGPSARISR